MAVNNTKYKVFPTQWCKSLHWFSTSPSIVLTVSIFMLHPSFSSWILRSLENWKFIHPSLYLYALTMSLCPVQHSLSAVYLDYSIHEVQHPPGILLSHSQSTIILTIMSWPLNIGSALHSLFPDRPLTPSSPWNHKGKVNSSHSQGCMLTNWRIQSQYPSHLPPNLPPPDRPPLSICLIFLNHCIKVNFKILTLSGSKWITNLVWYLSQSSHNHSLQVHLKSWPLTASKMISKFTR